MTASPLPAARARSRFARAALAALPLALLLAACGPKGDAPAAGAGAPPPPEVGVVVVEPRAVGLTVELPGRLEASRVAQVRARSAGIVQKILFREGSDVRAGQPLFQIDAAPLRASVQSAEASLARAQAGLGQATAQVDRFKPLVEANAISKQEFVNAVAAQKSAQADVSAGRAAVQAARINLGYASVTSPIAGRIGRALVTEGALVGQGEPTPLAVVQQVQTLYVNFTQPASEVLRLRRALASGQLKRASGPEAASVRIVLEDGSEYPATGRLLFSDLSVDPTSGQVMLRAEVPNAEGLLLPNLYVRVRLEQAQVERAITLPQQAVNRSPQGDTVMVVGADGKLAARTVKVGGEQSGLWVILDGLKPGEQVMVDGFQKVRGPGTPVKPVPWQPRGAASAPAAGASAGTAAPAASAGGGNGAAGAGGPAAASR